MPLMVLREKLAQMQARAEKADRELHRRPRSTLDHTLEERVTKAESRAAELETRLSQLERELQSFHRDRHATSVVHQVAVDDNICNFEMSKALRIVTEVCLVLHSPRPGTPSAQV